MRILSLETSTLRGSVAAIDAQAAIAIQRLPSCDLRIAQSLAPAVNELLAEVGWTPQDVQLIAVTEGPGSFTGLRAGITFAKVLAYATGAEVVAVNTLRAIAAQAKPTGTRVWTASDAQRQQLFTALWDASSDPPAERQRSQIQDRAAWLDQLQSGDLVTGPGLKAILNDLPQDVEFSPEDTWQPTALATGNLAAALHQTDGASDLWKLVPNYYRKSAAEEKLETK